ncbi:MAG TPA: PP2C family protein-serine/threonine phosphatase [Terriglobia bacterium]|nr:PP2C family protein-serine/threonine phosphatase [Terriglobia bacterium]
MSAPPQIQSVAFRQAGLRSERVRIIGILTTLAVGTLVGILRIWLVHAPQEISLFPWLLLVVGIMAGYEWLMLSLVAKKIAAQEDVDVWTLRLNHFIETLFPTLALVLATMNPIVGPYRALVSPIALLYFFFIILSTLRLDPGHCRLTGLFSSGGYVAVCAFTLLQYPAANRIYAPGTFSAYATLILLGGFVAGAVAGEIRKHVIASLQEAETRRQMERIEQDLNIARNIQQGLLPSKPPLADEFDIAGWNHPADATGGDYYDWQELPDGKVVISLGDVTGHGIGPALMMAACRAYARAGFASSGNLGDAVSHLNRLLVNDLPEERFVTYVAALLDPALARFDISSAGHGPLLLYRAAADQFEEIEAQGIPLGLFNGFLYNPPRQYEMARGDMLVLMTDGFFEWANAQDVDFGISRVQESLRASRGLPAAEIIARLYADVKQFSGGTPQADDLTAVVIKRTTVA